MTTASVDVENTVDVAKLRRSSIKKISVTQAELDKFKAKFPASAGNDDATTVYFGLKDSVDRLKFFNFLVVEQFRSVNKLDDRLVADAKSLDPMYVDWCITKAAKRLASPRHKSH